jgi:hypothetical protein
LRLKQLSEITFDTIGAITGVLDWDMAESAPVEAVWQMPAWLWDKEASGSTQQK